MLRKQQLSCKELDTTYMAISLGTLLWEENSIYQKVGWGETVTKKKVHMSDDANYYSHHDHYRAPEECNMRDRSK